MGKRPTPINRHEIWRLYCDRCGRPYTHYGPLPNVPQQLCLVCVMKRIEEVYPLRLGKGKGGE